MEQHSSDSLILQDQPPPEQWKPFPVSGLETLYEISDLGRIRTLVRRKTMRAGQFLKLKPRKSGYCDANIKGIDGKRKHYPVHRLVMMAFDPHPNADNLEVNHEDGNPSNNNLTNLTWMTHKANILHYVRVLKPARDIDKMDMRSNVEKLTKAEVEFIHRLMAEQFPIEKIAAMFCVSVDDLASVAQVA